MEGGGEATGRVGCGWHAGLVFMDIGPMEPKLVRFECTLCDVLLRICLQTTWA